MKCVSSELCELVFDSINQNRKILWCHISAAAIYVIITLKRTLPTQSCSHHLVCTYFVHILIRIYCVQIFVSNISSYQAIMLKCTFPTQSCFHHLVWTYFVRLFLPASYSKRIAWKCVVILYKCKCPHTHNTHDHKKYIFSHDRRRHKVSSLVKTFVRHQV